MHGCLEALDLRIGVQSPHGTHRTSFFADCKLDSYRGYTPECMKLRNLFISKELATPMRCLPKNNILVRAGLARQEWIHSSQDDIWWKCCETRGSLGGGGAANWVDDFVQFNMGSAPGYWGRAGMMNEFSYPSRSKPRAIQMLPELAQAKQLAHLGGADIPNPDYKDNAPRYLPPSGPKMECEPYEALKHKAANDGGREVEDVVKVKGPIGGPLTGGLGGLFCDGPWSVALTQMKPGTARWLRIADAGFCIYTGPPGVADVPGRKYKVFELAMPLSMTALLPRRRERMYVDFL